MAPRRVLVTGGAGFIGSHLVPELLQADHHVTVLDDLSSGVRGNVPADARFVHGSILDPDAVQDAMENVDVVVHLAAVASVARSWEAPAETADVNVTGTIRVAHAASTAGASRVIFASSAAIYGSSKTALQREADPPAPASPYAVHKLAGEQYLSMLAGEAALDVRLLRFFNVYGPRQDPTSPYSGVISLFARALLAGDPLTVFGDGYQSRDFLFAPDLARILRGMVEDDAPAPPSPMNIARSAPTTVLDLIDALKTVTGIEPEVRFGAPRPGDVRTSLGDPGRLRTWWRSCQARRQIAPHEQPLTTDLEGGLAATLTWLAHDLAASARDGTITG